MTTGYRSAVLEVYYQRRIGQGAPAWRERSGVGLVCAMIPDA